MVLLVQKNTWACHAPVQPVEWRCGHPGSIASSGIREKTGTFRTAEDRNIELELLGLSATIAENGSEAQSGRKEKIVLARTKEESLTGLVI